MRLVSGVYPEAFPFADLDCVDSVISTKDPARLTGDDMLLIWGGEDISPSLYGKAPHRWSGAKWGPSSRDRIEWALMQRAQELNIPIIGVCRGAQMLCALAGGHLIQHVDHHGRTHVVETPSGYEFVTNSCHHQMMYPFNVKHEMLASIKTPLSEKHYDVTPTGDDLLVEMKEEPEYVYFPEVKGHAIQWHPEWLEADDLSTEYIFQEIMKRV